MKPAAKIALLVPTITRAGGGVSEAVRLLHDAIVAEGHWKIEIHTIIAPGFEDACKPYGLTPIYGSPRADPTRYGYSPGLVRNLLASDADILHVHGLWGFHCLAAYLWHLKTGRPYVITPHGMLEHWIMQRSRLFKAAITKIYQGRFLRQAAAIQVLTDKEKTDVNRVSPGLPMTKIPNFVVAPKNLSSLGRPAWWNDNLTGRKIFLFFGRIHEKKGCIELCDAWERRCHSDPKFATQNALVFCGWVDGLDTLAIKIQSLTKTFGNVIEGGPQFGEDKWRSLAAATFMILPSKSEGLPLAVLEAWAVGLPVVMTSECNLGEGFSIGAAHAINPDVESIEKGLEFVGMLTPENISKMSKAALQLTETLFSRKAVCSRMTEFYESALRVGSN